MNRLHAAAAALLGLALSAGCGFGVARYDVRGQIISIEADRDEVTIRHDDIPGLMPAMTMPFRVRDASLLADRVPGDLVAGTLVVARGQAYLTSLRRIGHAAIVPASDAPPASSSVELLRPGDLVPDVTLVDEAGREQRLSAWQGRAVALTFIFTRCPFPTFCPMMDRQFAALQRTVLEDPALRGRVRLLSVSFDPDYDTPDVLRAHARSVEADPAAWSFVTGDRDEIDRFAARFGVTILRGEAEAADITHNLRTAVIDARGALVKVYTGNEWTAGDLERDLRDLRTGA